MLRTTLRIASAAILLAAASFASAQTDQVVSGSTKITVNSEFLSFLQSYNVTVAGAASTTLGNGQVTLPIVNGTVDLKSYKGEIGHTGGLIFSSGGETVAVTDFTIDTTNGDTLTAIVTVNGSVYGRAPLFNIAPTQPPAISGSDSQVLSLSGVNVVLSSQMAAYLNAAFGGNVFKAGTQVGTASLVAIVTPLTAAN